MSALIDGTYQCLDAAVETLDARWGRGGSKGTLSKKLSLALDWTVADVIALEDAAGRFPVTGFLARRLQTKSVSEENSIKHACNISKESGEAVAAILAAEQSARSECRADAVKELSEAIDAMVAARSRLESEG